MLPKTRRKLFLHLYRGNKCIFRKCLHVSCYIEQDVFEWTYGTSSMPSTTHQNVYHGVVYEYPRQYTYGDWVFWKSIEVGSVPTGFGGGTRETVAGIRQHIKAMVGADVFKDEGYHIVYNNCWDFCYAFMAHFNCPKERPFIETFNDELQRVYSGTTYAVLCCMKKLCCCTQR